MVKHLNFTRARWIPIHTFWKFNTCLSADYLKADYVATAMIAVEAPGIY